MSMSHRATEVVVPVGWIAAVTTHASTYVLSNAISLDANTGRRFRAVINVGTPGASATVDAEFRWSATSGGTYATITGTAITQQTATGLIVIEVSTEQVVAFAPTAAYIKLAVKVAVADTPYSAVIDAFEQANNPATIPSGFTANVLTTVTGPVSGVA